MSNSFKVDVSPSMEIYRHHQNYPYSIQTALAEFIDNSVQSYIDHQKTISTIDKKKNSLKVKICIKKETNEINVIDNAGGINKENFEKAIQLGTNVKYPETSLSKFGLGMKTAATWFSSIWQIETSALNSTDKLTSEFNLDELEQKRETKISVFVDKEKEKIHYTKIIIKNSQRIESKEYYEEVVIPHLTETFFKFKNLLSIRVEFDNEVLESKKNGRIKKAYFDPPEPLNCPILDKDNRSLKDTNKKWRRNIEINYGNRKVKGHFRIMKKGSYLQPGIRLLRNRRVIEGTIVKPNRPKILFGTGLNKYAGFRLYGELHLTNFELDFMKTKFVGLDPLYFELKKELQKAPSFIHQLNRLRKDTDTTSEIEEETPEKSILRKKDGQSQRKRRASTNDEKIIPSQEINSKLSNLNHKKIHDLYKSLCDISLKKYPYLSYVGGCIFLDCLASYMGNPDNNPFESFLKSKASNFYGKKEGKRKSIQRIIGSINSTTNDIKHYHEREIKSAIQLNGDFKVLERFIIKCIDDITDE